MAYLDTSNINHPVLYLHPDDYVVATDVLRATTKQGLDGKLVTDTKVFNEKMIKLVGDDIFLRFLEIVARGQQVTFRAHSYIQKVSQ